MSTGWSALDNCSIKGFQVTRTQTIKRVVLRNDNILTSNPTSQSPCEDLLVFSSHLSCVCLCMCARVHTIACIWRSDDKWQLLILSVYCIDWVTRLGNWAIILLSHLADPVLAFLGICAAEGWWKVIESCIFFFFDILGQEGYGELSWLSNCKQVYFNDLFVLIQNCKRNGGCHCPIVCLMRGTRLILGMTSLTEKHVKKTHKAITSEIPQKLGLARTGSSIWRLFWGTRKDPVRPSTVSESQCHGASRAKDKFLVGTVI